MEQSSLNPKRIANTPRIYVASLADHTAGRLLGRWIDADQPAEAIIQQIQANQKITQDVLEALSTCSNNWATYPAAVS